VLDVTSADWLQDSVRSRNPPRDLTWGPDVSLRSRRSARVQAGRMEDDLLANPANFPELMLLPHLDDEWTEVRLGRRSDGAWEVYVTIRVDDGYRNEASAQAVADHYRENLQAFVEHRRKRRGRA
jgi:hypothetical protein